MTTTLETLREAAEREELETAIAEARSRRRLLETTSALYDSFVDPCEATLGDEGRPWPVVGQVGQTHAQWQPFRTEAELNLIRNQCRRLMSENEFALSGHENRISYLIGSGHQYHIAPTSAVESLDDSTREIATRILKRFCSTQVWGQRQQEIVRRLDRDGECFLRFFPVREEEGLIALRFVEPDQVFTPTHHTHRDEAAWGILTDPQDVETIEGYFIDEQLIPAEEIQHRKANVDRNARRGVPLFYPVLGNLERCEKLLRNMSVLAQTQAAIAVVRKHQQATAANVQAFADAQASLKQTNRTTGQTQRYKKLAPGTILDAPAGIEYDFPSIGVNAASLVAVLQAELRAIAARLVMPEFMLSADASNANYASTLIAEGPAVKHFRRLQTWLIADDLLIFDRLFRRAVEVGILSTQQRQQFRIETEPPSLVVRDRKHEAEANAIKFRHGIKSRQTWQMEEGLDPAEETENFLDDPLSQMTPK